MSQARVKAADRLRRAMKATFTDAEVLIHLANYCGAMRTSFSSDPLEMARREGRREVWLEIQKNLNLTEEDLYNFARNIGEDYE